MKIYISFIILVSISLVFSEERKFKLKSGNSITGEIIEIDSDGNYKVLTSVGEVFFNSNDIVPERVKIITKDGDKILGVLTSEDNNTFYVKSNIGVLSINKNDVKLIDFNSNTSKDDWEFNLSKSENRFYFGDEQLIDLWFDPTGNVLSEGTIYMSGLSAAYGLTDKFQISLRVWDYLFGNVNIRPKYQIYKSGSLEQTKTVSVGAHFYLSGSVPHKWKWEKSDDIGDCSGEYYNEETDSGICEESNGPWNWSAITSRNSSYELFIAYTSSKLKPSGQGRTNYNAGLSISSIDGYSGAMPRLWLGFDTDVRQSLKLIGLLAYDEYLPTIDEFFSGEEKTNIILDFGFIYAFNEQFRLGAHLTSPFLAFYWKF